MERLLPAAIEAALRDAGFSNTEILVLRKLVEEKSLTLREFALKTGKSTGVLDQAMKKLLQKGIVKKGSINAQPRYAIDSLDAIVHWVTEDARLRKEALERRNRDFASFVESLRLDRRQPEMESFQGWEGIVKAYTKLLASAPELLTITPVLTTAEDDPLRAFRVEYFRRRQVRKIFQRVLAPDTPLSRRFRSKDPFEFRQTLLLPEAEYALGFEKTIAGDYVCCINFADQTAYLIRYPELAAAERAAFESLWARRLAEERGEAPPPQATLPVVPTEVPVKTRLLSRFRQFILSRQSVVAFVAFALLSCTVTAGLYLNARDLNLQRVRERAKAVAATGALQFDVRDIDAVRTPADIGKPQYAKLVATLNMIRRSNPGIQYAYILRQTDQPGALAFVADADSLYPGEKKDLNGDAKIDEADQLVSPGEQYDTVRFPYIRQAFTEPFADPEPATDQWGTFIAGAAPIRSGSGAAAAILGVDILASDIDRLTAESFSPLLVLIGCFLLFVLIRFAALNRPLVKAFLASMSIRRWLLTILIVIGVIVGVLYGMYRYTLGIVIEDTGQRLMSIAVTAASQFDPKDLDQLHFARDMKTEVYQRVFRKLNEIRNLNPEIKYAYIFRPMDQQNTFQFIADADTNFNLNLPYSFNEQGAVATAEKEGTENLSPGTYYVDTTDIFYSSYKPAYSVIVDKWGTLLTASAPIINDDGNRTALLSLDVDLSKLKQNAIVRNWQKP